MCPNSSQTNFTNLDNNCPFSAGHTGTNINRWSLLFWHRNFKAIFLQAIPRRGVFIWTGPHSNLNPHHPKGSLHPIVVAPEPWGSFLEFHFTAWGILLSSETLLDFGEQFGNCPLTSMNVPPSFPRDVNPFAPVDFELFFNVYKCIMSCHYHHQNTYLSTQSSLNEKDLPIMYFTL